MSCPNFGTTLTSDLQTTAVGQIYTVPNSCEPTVPFVDDTITLFNCPNNGEFTTASDCGAGYCSTSVDWNFSAEDVGFKASLSYDIADPFSPSVDGDFTGTIKMNISSDGTTSGTNNFLGCNKTSSTSPSAGMSSGFSLDPSVSEDGGTFNASINPSFSDQYNVQIPFTGCPATCTRVKYNAPEAACCLTNSTPNSFSTGTLVDLNGDISNPTDSSLVTCDPSFTNLNGSPCDSPVASFCSADGNFGNLGGIMDNKDFKQWKVNGSCFNYAKSTNSDTGKLLTLEQSLVALNKKYPIERLGNAGQGAIDAWSGIQDACSANPGVCDSSLDQICSKMSRDDIAAAGDNLSDPSQQLLYAACACHLSGSQYSQYAGIIDEGSYNECDPLCLGPTAIKKGVDGQTVECDETNCVIDDVTINIIDSNTGNIDFNQVCGGTGGSNCYFSDDNVLSQSSQTGSINFSQNCNSCFVYQDGNPYNPTPVSCDGSGSTPLDPVGWRNIFGDVVVQFESIFQNIASSVQNSPKTTIPIIIVVSVVILILIVSLFFVF